MYTGLLHSHSMLRYVVLALLLAVVIVSLTALLTKRPYKPLDNKLSLFLTIGVHLQLLLGLGLYFTSPWVQFASETMKDKSLRYWTVEHIALMLLAIVLVTIARSTVKKMSLDAAKHKRTFVFNAIALLLIVVSILSSGRGLIG
jgi:hypothetical protein